MKYRILAALMVLLLPAVANAGWLGDWQCLWGNDCDGVNNDEPLLAGPSADEGLWEDAPIGAISNSDWLHYRWEFITAERLPAGGAVSVVPGWDTDLIAGSLSPSIITGYSGGQLQLVAAAVENQGGQILHNVNTSAGAFLKPASGRTIIWEARVYSYQWPDNTYAFGLVAPTGAQPMLAADATWQGTVTDFVGFYHDGNSGANNGTVECGHLSNTGAYTDAGDATSALTGYAFHVFSIRIEDQQTVEWYVDGELKCSATTGAVIDLGLAPVFLFLNEQTANENILVVDYLDVWQTRLAGDPDY